MYKIQVFCTPRELGHKMYFMHSFMAKPAKNLLLVLVA